MATGSSPHPAAFPLFALAFILAATAAWWALALWPLPEAPPPWLARTREICFGAVHNGLPTPAGWMALILEPVALVAALAVVWGRDLRAGIQELARRPATRAVLAGSVVLMTFGLVLAVARVGAATPSGERFDAVAGKATRRSGPAPSLSLKDQEGNPFGWERLGGRPAVVGFVFAHCATVCPTLVHDLLAARGRGAAPALVLVTLDPRRDTPARLPAIAREWGLGPEDFLLGGAVGEVEATITAWGVPWQRDTLTGEIHHGTQLFVVSTEGRLEWVVAGGGAGEAVRKAVGG